MDCYVKIYTCIYYIRNEVTYSCQWILLHLRVQAHKHAVMVIHSAVQYINASKTAHLKSHGNRS